MFPATEKLEAVAVARYRIASNLSERAGTNNYLSTMKHKKGETRTIKKVLEEVNSLLADVYNNAGVITDLLEDLVERIEEIEEYERRIATFSRVLNKDVFGLE